jgi:hypothetical protein
MPPVGFEPMISVLERAKTVLALDRTATAIDILLNLKKENYVSTIFGILSICFLVCVFLIAIGIENTMFTQFSRLVGKVGSTAVMLY